MSKTGSGILVLIAVLTMSAPVAGEPSGAAACSGCHASNAEGPVPNLVGRSAREIVTAMADFRNGAREATVMDRIAKGFSDEEIRAIAEWYAAGQNESQP